MEITTLKKLNWLDIFRTTTSNKKYQKTYIKKENQIGCFDQEERIYYFDWDLEVIEIDIEIENFFNPQIK